MTNDKLSMVSFQLTAIRAVPRHEETVFAWPVCHRLQHLAMGAGERQLPSLGGGFPDTGRFSSSRKGGAENLEQNP